MITQAKDFLNNIHRELEDFITTTQGVNDDFPASWYTTDYDEVQKTIEWMKEDSTRIRPIIQTVELNSPVTAKALSHRYGEVQKIIVNIALYIIVTDDYSESKKRKIILNSLASELKYKFDNYDSNLPHFRNLSVGLPDGMLNRDDDGVYSCRVDLYAEIRKKVR